MLEFKEVEVGLSVDTLIYSFNLHTYWKFKVSILIILRCNRKK